MQTLESEARENLCKVVSGIREMIAGTQYWSGGLVVPISHCFLEKDRNCGGLVEITRLEDWLHYLNLHCIACNIEFRLYYQDLGLEAA